MAVNEKDFLESAKALLIPPSTEIDFRNSASRAYYSTLHSCMRIVNTFPTVGSKSVGGTHAQAIEQLLNPPTSVSKDKSVITKRAGYMLKHMRSIRTKADYNITLNFEEKDSAEILKYAENITPIVESYFK